ncbi:MAG: pantoate--beta-alanine ligase [FCB group bacterium]|jgi:pantoate--beta-alanine ligase|nr:pantoate--beta-alanine ligase [FCB group bacterium]
MIVLRDPDSMREWSREQRRLGKTIGFVPTMGALHEGHASLMRAAARENDVSVLSIFVNPTQFGPNEDLDKYPRTFEADSRMAEEIGVAVVYAPTASAMYPDGYATYVAVERLTEGLCGRSRPTHFRGVTTVVTKLFLAVLPDKAYFGQKDAQQCAVIRRMTRDLDFGIEIVPMPIVREADGLAMSSRNRYLSPDERRRALVLSQALEAARRGMDAGERDPERVLADVRSRIVAAEGVELDYAELVDADDITPLDRIRGRVLLAVAARVGQTRLIDNIEYEVAEECC